MHATRPISLRVTMDEILPEVGRAGCGKANADAGYICLTERPLDPWIAGECLLCHQGLHSPCPSFALSRATDAPIPPLKP